MSDTFIQARPSPTAGEPSGPSRSDTSTARRSSDGGDKPRRSSALYYPKQALKALASLRLTVVLFVLSMILVFCGTLAQMDEGLYSVLAHYFRCFLAWIPLQVFVRFGQVFFGLSPDLTVRGSFPFPGGWLIGGLLLVNLLAAHLVRFRLTWKRSGILILHSGLILLMVGELVTGLFAVESMMIIPVGGESNYVQNSDRIELAFTTPANDQKKNDVVVIPGSILRKGDLIQNEKLPVDVKLVRYMANSYLPKERGPGADNLATAGFGLDTVAIEQKPGRGVDAEQKHDMPSAYVTLKDKTSGESLGTYLVSTWWLNPQEVGIGGKTYQLALRQERTYKPYTFHLKELHHETYEGTNIPRNYSSLIRLKDESRNEDRDVLIWMNHPLFYHGETFYQASVEGDLTGLQVVRNPGWLLPYLSCFMVALGMLVHFGLHLLGFLSRRTAS